MTSPNAGRATTPNDIRKKFLGFEDVWYLIVAELEYHDMLAAQAALPVVDALLAQYRVPRRALFLEPMGPAIVWLHVHADLLLNDEIGRRHSHVLVLAVPSVVRKIEQEILRLGAQIDSDEDSLGLIFDPESRGATGWDVILSGPTQELLRTAPLYSTKAFFHGDFAKAELENPKSTVLDLHPEIFQANTPKFGQHRREISMNENFKLLDEFEEVGLSLSESWDKSLLTQPPVAQVCVRFAISHRVLVGQQHGRQFYATKQTNMTTYVHNTGGVRLGDIQSMMLRAKQQFIMEHCFRISLRRSDVFVRLRDLDLDKFPTADLQAAVEEER
ncbi:hypothetical protein IWZ01DRAFT_562206 [Phyllosticta capitalensis]